MNSSDKYLNCNENLEDALGRPWKGRAIMHLDLDAFFAAVAQKDNPALVGQPVIVGGSPEKRGVVSTASYEARKFGVHSAMSSAEAIRRCPQAHFVPVNFKRYRELSAIVMGFIEDRTPLVERASIDEAYADITPRRSYHEHPIAIARDIQRRIENLGLSGSIGISTNKTTSKIGSDFIKPRGLTIIRPGDEAAFLAPLPIEKLGGIGRSTANKLHDIHIRTLGELASVDKADLEPLLGSMAQSLIERAGGIDVSEVITERITKSVSNENTYEHDLTSTQDILSELKRLSEKVCWRLRSKNLTGKTITLKLKFTDFSQRTLSYTLESATSTDSTVTETVQRLYEHSPYRGHAIRLLGVGVANFCEPVQQLSLFDEAHNQQNTEHDREEKLLGHIDEIRKKFGYESIGSGNDL